MDQVANSVRRRRPNLLTVVHDRINWTHEHGFFVFLSLKATERTGDGGRGSYYRSTRSRRGIAALQPDTRSGMGK